MNVFIWNVSLNTTKTVQNLLLLFFNLVLLIFIIWGTPYPTHITCEGHPSLTPPPKTGYVHYLLKRISQIWGDIWGVWKGNGWSKSGGKWRNLKWAKFWGARGVRTGVSSWLCGMGMGRNLSQACSVWRGGWCEESYVERVKCLRIR